MKIFKEFFLVFTKTYLRIKGLVLCIFLLPIVVVTLINVFNSPEKNSLTVGLYAQGNGKIEQRIIAELLENDEINFVLTENDDTIENKVINGEYNLVYIFSHDFTNSVMNADTDSSVMVVKLADDFYYKYIDPIIISLIFNEIVPHMASENLNSYDIEHDFDELSEKIISYQTHENAFSIEKEYMNSNVDSSENMLLTNILRGTICIFLVVISLMAVSISSSQNKSISLYKPYCSVTLIKIYSIIPIFIFSYFSALISVIITKFFVASIDVVVESALLLLLQFSLFLISFLISEFMKKELIVIFAPFIILFVLISHPIILDFTSQIPLLWMVLSFLPSYQYMTFTLSILPQIFIINLILLSLLIIRKKTEK